MALNDVVYNKTVDVAQSMPVPVIFAKQNENGKRKVIVTLLKDGQPFVIGSDISGYIQGATAPNPATKQPVRFKRDLTLIDAEGNASTITFVIAESMTAEIGITQCEIALYDSTKPNEILCTANINIEVQGTGMSPQDEMASDDYQAIVSIKAEVTAMRDEVRDKTNQAIAAKSAAETAAQNAYNSALGVQKIVAGNEAYTKQETDLKYSVAPRKVQTSTTGELKLTDADYGLSYIELEGNSEQYTNTANKNLIDLEYQKLHGINENRYLNINGVLTTPTSDKDWKVSYYIKVKPSTVYAFTDLPTSSVTAIAFYTQDKTFISAITNMAVLQNGGRTTTPPNCEYMRVSYRAMLENTLQLEEGNVATAYIKGAVDTPSPEYPSEVKSVGDIPKDVNGVEIRNLLDEEWIRSLTESDFTKAPNDRVYYIDVSGRLPKSYLFTKGFLVGDKVNIRVFLSDTPGNGSQGHCALFVDANGTPASHGYDASKYDTMVLNFYVESITFDMVLAAIKNYKFMATSAAEIDEYRPYIGENNGLVKIESSGVNKVDVGQKPVYDTGTNNINIIKWTPQEIILDQKGGGTSYAYANVNLIVGKTYSFYCRAQVVTIDGSPTNGATTIGFRKYPPSGMIYGQTSVARDGTYHDCYSKIELPEDVSLMLYVNSTSSSGGNVRLIVKDLMVVEGDRTLQEMKALKYQPYHQQITWIPLREPLRKITGLGTYQDSIDQDGFVTQCILKCVLDGSIGGIYGGPVKEDLIGFSVKVESLLVASIRAVWCNKLAYLNSPSDASREGCAEANRTLTIIVKKARLESADLAGFKKWLSDQYSKGEPVIAYPATITPITYKIPAVYIETYDQETNVRCLNKVKPSDMTLDYKLAINSLIKRLEALETTTVQEVTK